MILLPPRASEVALKKEVSITNCVISIILNAYHNTDAPAAKKTRNAAGVPKTKTKGKTKVKTTVNDDGKVLVRPAGYSL